MKVYIHDYKTNGDIVQLCRDAGVEYITHDDIIHRRQIPGRSHFFLDTVDALIMEVTKPTQDIQFILAQSILAEKPTLCVYGKNQTPTSLIRYIKKPNAKRRNIRTFSYTKKTLPQGVCNFIAMHHPDMRQKKDSATVKFTLRLTPRIEEYLEWLNEEHKESKADIIREMLQQRLEGDEQYALHVDGE